MTGGGLRKGQLTSQVTSEREVSRSKLALHQPACACVCVCALSRVRGQRHEYLMGEWDAVIQSGLAAHRVGERAIRRRADGGRV